MSHHIQLPVLLVHLFLIFIQGLSKLPRLVSKFQFPFFGLLSHWGRDLYCHTLLEMYLIRTHEPNALLRNLEITNKLEALVQAQEEINCRKIKGLKDMQDIIMCISAEEEWQRLSLGLSEAEIAKNCQLHWDALIDNRSLIPWHMKWSSHTYPEHDTVGQQEALPLKIHKDCLHKSSKISSQILKSSFRHLKSPQFSSCSQWNKYWS